MALNLSEGALETIMGGGNVDAPVMQILGSKKLASNNNSTERYRLLISDGRHLNSFAMVATQLNDLVASGQLCEFTVVKINRYITSMVNTAADKERRVIVILELEVLRKGTEVGIRIGNPTQLDGLPSSNAASAAAPRAPPNPNPTPQRRPAQNNFGPQVQMSPGPNTPIHPISSLNPYQNKWCIKARVTNKMAPRTYTNARGEGKLFSVVFTDESGEIKCTGFNSCVDRFFDLLELNKVFLVSNCSLKAANKKFTQADYEMTFHDDSQVIPCPDDASVPSTIFNFTPIGKVAEMAPDSIVDVIGVAKSSGEVTTLVARNSGKELKKREVNLVDQSNVSVALTLWGTQAVDFDGSSQPVVACKGVKLNDFMGGRSLSVQMSSTIQINPDMEEAHRLRGWYDNGGATQEVASISAKTGGSGSAGNWVPLGELAAQGLGMGDKADYFSAVVTVMLARSENCVYKACPGSDCKKKVMDMNNGLYRCEKCNRDYDNFIYRLLLSLQVSDYSGSSWVTVFNEEAEKILSCTSKEIGEAMDNRDESYKEYFTTVAFKKFQMKFRTKMESYNDENRLKTTVVSAEPVDSRSYARRLLTDLRNELGVFTGRSN